MSAKRTTIVLGAACVLLILVLILREKKENNISSDLGFEDIYRINIEGSVEIFQDEEEWYVSDLRIPAQKDRVQSIIDIIRSINTDNIITSRETTYSKYEVDTASATIVDIHYAKEKTKKLYIGKRSPDYSKSYIRLENDPNVYIVTGISKYDFRRSREELSKKIFSAKVEDILKLNIIQLPDGSKQYSVEKSSMSRNTIGTVLSIRALAFDRIPEPLDAMDGLVNIEFVYLDGKPEKVTLYSSENKYYLLQDSWAYRVEISERDKENIVSLISIGKKN